MATFAIHYTYPDDSTDMTAVRPAHRAWLAALPGLLVAGQYQDARDEVSRGQPTTEEPLRGALIVYRAESLGDVTATFDDDPYWRAGLVLRRVVREWNPPLGPWAAEGNLPG